MFVQAGGYRNILKLSCGPLAFASYGVFLGAEGCLGLRSWAGGLGWGGDIGRGVDMYFCVFFCCCCRGLIFFGGGGGLGCVSAEI